jgi:rsbT antagonist protein RsbS
MVENVARVRRIPLQLSRDCVVASIQIDLGDEILRQFRADLLEALRSSRAKGVILDLSGVQILDREDFEGLRQTMTMTAVMGARPLICGLQPGVVASLVELGADLDGVEAAADLDGAFELMEALRAGGDNGAEDGAPEPPAADREEDRR